MIILYKLDLIVGYCVVWNKVYVEAESESDSDKGLLILDFLIGEFSWLDKLLAFLEYKLSTFRLPRPEKGE